MNSINEHYTKKPGQGKKWAGLILLILGVILLIRSLGGFIPDWLTSWPMILILLGLFSGFRHNFRNPGAFILIVIGTLFLAGRVIPGIELHDFIFPVLVIGLGLYLILGKKKFRRMYGDHSYDWDKRVAVSPTEGTEPVNPGVEKEEERQSEDTKFDNRQAFSREDYLDTVSVFGSIKKNVVSKHFLGGDIVTIMGGAEINLTQADIQGTVVIEVTQVFGGTKLIVPPQWKVASDLAALFGGIEDKRPLMQAGSLAEDKVLILRGTSIFGGIDIRCF